MVPNLPTPQIVTGMELKILMRLSARMTQVVFTEVVGNQLSSMCCLYNVCWYRLESFAMYIL